MVLDEEEATRLIQQDASRRDADRILDSMLNDEEFRRVFLAKVKGAALIHQ